jgi:hypothetical protein
MATASAGLSSTRAAAQFGHPRGRGHPFLTPDRLVTIDDPRNRGQHLAEVGSKIVGASRGPWRLERERVILDRDFIRCSSSWRLLLSLPVQMHAVPKKFENSTGDYVARG